MRIKKTFVLVFIVAVKSDFTNEWTLITCYGKAILLDTLKQATLSVLNTDIRIRKVGRYEKDYYINSGLSGEKEDVFLQELKKITP